MNGTKDGKSVRSHCFLKATENRVSICNFLSNLNAARNEDNTLKKN